MKEMEMPVSEQVFHSLIFGHSKLGDFESADRVMVIMQDTGLEIDPAAYAANLKGMIAFGKTYAEVSEALENLKDKGVNLNDQGKEKRNKNDPLDLIDYLVMTQT
jgi:pentatricopeptide repeat protein